jgi:hypothetical protein
LAWLLPAQQLQAGSHDKKVLLVMSHGGDNANAHDLANVLQVAEQSSAIIYSIGLFDLDDPDRNPKVLKRLARETGGEAFFPEELSAVVAVCESIARDIRNQYTVGYVSANVTPNGAYRAIRVVARAAERGKTHRANARRLHCPWRITIRQGPEGAMRIVAAKEPLRRILQWVQRALFACAVSLLGYYGFVLVDAWIFQRQQGRDLDRLLYDGRSASAGTPQTGFPLRASRSARMTPAGPPPTTQHGVSGSRAPAASRASAAELRIDIPLVI